MNYTLIGMSGAGKSFVGKQLATALGYDFFDVDTAMELQYNKPLQQILDELGDEQFLLQQAELIKQTDFSNPHIISTGGSVVYTEDAMEHLKEISKVVFIDVPLSTIASRVDTASRGVVGLRGATFAELYAQRHPLYVQWADLTITGEEPIATIASYLTD